MMQSDDAPPAPPIPLVAQPPHTNPTAPAKLLPYSLFDVVLDLSHPGASRPNATEVIYTPSNVGGGIVDILPLDQLVAEFGPETTNTNGGPQPPSQGGAKIARFAFPEYEDRCNAQEVANRHAVMQRTYGGGVNTSPGLNRHDLYLEEVCSLPSENIGGGGVRLSPVLPSYHAFSHRLANGSIVHGHVRRYLSPREDNGRIDVGRRSIRAIVILTRNPGGGGRLYMAMLKTLEVLRYKAANANERMWFLHSMFREHVNLCRDVASAMMTGAAATGGGGASPLSKPRIITVPLLETGRGHGLFGNVDTIKFACPPSFLHEREPTHYIDDSIMGLSRNDMMPMLRCLGVVRTMRLLSALVSERRVILTSGNVSKLSAVGYGAMSMLGQGLLPPPSVFVPVLPPGLSSLLSTPSAYVIGVLRGSTPNFIDLKNLLPSLGEIVVFDLDTLGNEPYFANTQNPAVFVPDLTRRSFEDVGDSSLNGMSLPDMLYQDLSEVIKSDKKQMFWQGAVQEKLGMAAEKGKTAAKAAMKKGLKYLKDKKRAMDGNKEVKEEDEEEDESADQMDNSNALTKLVGKGSYFYDQGFPNESAEVEARIAFSTFFVSLFGDMRAYLTQASPGMPPVADKDKFMKYRQANGDLPGSPMYNLVGNFLRSNLYDQFVNARLRELQLRRSVPEDAPFFALTANYHRSNKIDFTANNIRQSVRQVAMNPNLPGKFLTSWNEGIRRRVLDLTSTQTFNGDPLRAIALLTEDCHESSTILIDTIMILWTRIQEGKGMQWKKALLALQVFRDLLLNGPITMIAEVIDGFASIRIMKSYTEALRGQNSLLVRAAAAEVYSLVVDLPVLFARRRECLNRQRMLKDPKPSPLRKETRMIKGIAQFRNVHIALRPAGATVAPAPPAVTVNDLLGQDLFSSTASTQLQTGSYSSDLLSLGVDAIPEERHNKPNPFDMAAMTQNVPEGGDMSKPASANQQTPQQARNHSAAPATNIAIPPNFCASQPQSNNGTLLETSHTPSAMQSKQQEMTQHQNAPFPSKPTLQQGIHHLPVQSSVALHVPPMQRQPQLSQEAMNQPPFHSMQRSVASHQMNPPCQSQPTMVSFIPPQQPHIQQPFQQWGHVSPQPIPPCQPQGFQAGMPPSARFQSAMQPPQFQHGLPQQQEQQKQPPLQQQQSRPTFSMFDPMAK